MGAASATTLIRSLPFILILIRIIIIYVILLLLHLNWISNLIVIWCSLIRKLLMLKYILVIVIRSLQELTLIWTLVLLKIEMVYLHLRLWRVKLEWFYLIIWVKWRVLHTSPGLRWLVKILGGWNIKLKLILTTAYIHIRTSFSYL